MGERVGRGVGQGTRILTDGVLVPRMEWRQSSPGVQRQNNNNKGQFLAMRSYVAFSCWTWKCRQDETSHQQRDMCALLQAGLGLARRGCRVGRMDDERSRGGRQRQREGEGEGSAIEIAAGDSTSLKVLCSKGSEQSSTRGKGNKEACGSRARG